jgi:hypothetical protein
MTTIAGMRRRWEGLNTRDVAEESIDATREQLADTQRDQMLHGLRADGKPIGKYRNPAYAAMKNAMNPLPGYGNMDWRLTGQLHADIFIDVREGSFVITSGNEKTTELVEAFGDPFGIGGEFRNSYVRQLRPVFMGKVKEIVKT